jgi:hypothetical protein
MSRFENGKEVPMAGMMPEDIYKFTGVADSRISPDGTEVAFVVSRVD